MSDTMTDNTPYFTKSEIDIILAVGQHNQPRLKKDEELLNQEQLAEKADLTKKAFQRAKPKLEQYDLITSDEGGNGGMIKLSFTEKGEKIHEHFKAMEDLLNDES